MKIKEYFKKWERRVNILILIAFFDWFIIAIGEVLGLPIMISFYIQVIIFGAIVITTIFISMTKFVCPRCERKLKRGRRTTVSRLEKCPYCNKDFNDKIAFIEDYQ